MEMVYKLPYRVDSPDRYINGLHNLDIKSIPRIVYNILQFNRGNFENVPLRMP